MDLDTQISRLNSIVEKIILRINIKNKSSDYFFNHLCEGIFTVTFSEIFNKPFKNINIEKSNAPAADLKSNDEKIYIQVSSTGTTDKLYKTLKTFLKQEDYKDCEKLYLFIIGEKEGLYTKAKKEVKKILDDPSNKISGFKFDVDKDIIELKELPKRLIDKFSELHGNNERKLTPESLFKIVEDLSKSINGIEYALKSITEVDKNDYLNNSCIEKPKSIKRRLIDEDNNIFSEEDLVTKDELKYTFIYGDAGLGKTHLLNKLTFELFENSKENIENKVPFIINLKNIKHNISLEKQLPSCFGKRFKSLLVFDGYDEITIKEQTLFKNQLILYLESNKNTSCIIGSRTKIKKDEITFSQKNDSTKKKYNFKTLKIDFFNESEINFFIKNKGVDNSIFSHKNFLKLKSDFKTPYYLDLITNYYNDYNNLPESKLIVMEKLFNKSLIRLTDDDNRMLALETRNFLEKITFIFYYTEVKNLKDIELAKIIEYKNEVWKVINKHNSLEFKEDYEHWEISLTNQKELDFLFFSLLKKMDSQTLFEIFQADIILPDTWYNSLLLFNDDHEINQEIRSEMTKNFPFIYIKEFQTNPNDSFFTDNLRAKVFQEIFNKYEEKDIWIDFRIFDEKSYVEFGEIDENFAFLISKLNSINFRTRNKAISLLAKFSITKERTNTLFKELKKEINETNKEHTIWESYYCFSNYESFLILEQKKELIDLSVQSENSFLKNNEYIRASIYHFITVSNLEEEYIDYMLEGLKLLKYSNKGRIEGRSKTSLMDEGYKLDNLFYKITTKDKLILVVKEITLNYKEFDDYHTQRIYDKLINTIKEIIDSESNNKDFINKLTLIFSNYDVKVDNWYYWQEMMKNFNVSSLITKILKSEKVVLKKLFSKKDVLEKSFHFTSYEIAKLITNNSYLEIFKAYDNKKIEIGKVIDLYYLIETIDSNIALKMEAEISSRGGKIKKRENIITLEDKIKKAEIENFELLFSEDNFKKSILNFFGSNNQLELPWNEIPNWYKGQLYFHQDFRLIFLRDLTRHEDGRIVEKNIVITRFKKNLDWYLINTIFQNKSRINYNFSKDQITYLSNWISTQALQLNFKDAIHDVYNNSFKLTEDCNTIYSFAKELNVKLDKKTNLDLLSFFDINNINSDYNEYYNNYFKKLIKEIDDLEAVKKRVNENLNNKVKYYSVLNNHIIFSFNYNVIENYPLIEKLLIEYLPEFQHGHFHDNPILVYYDKSKNFEFLKNNFPNEITDLFWVLINYLVDNNEHKSFVEEKLLNKIDVTQNYDEKLRITSNLLQINSKNALKEFYSILFFIKTEDLNGQFRHYDYNTSINKYENEEIGTAIKIIELTYKFKFDNFDNPKREIIAYLKRMIIKNKENYNEIKSSIEKLIDNNKGVLENIQFLEFDLNDLKETFYSNYKSNYTLKDALKIISEIEI